MKQLHPDNIRETAARLEYHSRCSEDFYRLDLDEVAAVVHALRFLASMLDITRL